MGGRARRCGKETRSSHLFQRVASFLPQMPVVKLSDQRLRFSSLSESGFIPTGKTSEEIMKLGLQVLISFREWLHSYLPEVLSYVARDSRRFSSLSESGFIPTYNTDSQRS